MSLRFRLAILFFLTILAPTLLIGFIAYANAERVLLTQAANHMESLANTKELEIDMFLDNQENVYKAIASRTKLRATLATYNETFDGEQAGIIQDILVDAREPFGDAVTWLYMYGNDNTAIVGTEQLSDEELAPLQPYVERGRTAVQIFFDASFEHIITLGPVERDGEVLGVLAIKSSNKALERVINDYSGLGLTGETTLAQRTERGDAAFLHTKRFENDSAALSVVPKERLDIPITQALLRNEGVFFHVVDYREKHVVAASRYIEETDWGLVVKIDHEELFATLADFRYTLMIFVSIILIVTTIISLSVAQSITRPIVLLTQKAQDISERTFDTTLSEDLMHEQGEIRTLANVFQTMAKEIANAYTTLENKIAHRTQELAQKVEELERTNDMMIEREEKMIELKKKLKECKHHTHDDA